MLRSSFFDEIESFMNNTMVGLNDRWKLLIQQRPFRKVTLKDNESVLITSLLSLWEIASILVWNSWSIVLWIIYRRLTIEHVICHLIKMIGKSRFGDEWSKWNSQWTYWKCSILWILKMVRRDRKRIRLYVNRTVVEHKMIMKPKPSSQ